MIPSTQVIILKNVGHKINHNYIPILSKFHNSRIPTYQCHCYSQKFPRHPVPAIYDTMQRFVRSCIPFLTDTDYKKTKKLAVELATPGCYGERLQTYLENRAKTTESWLADWFINVTYLEYRNSLIPWSSVTHSLPMQRPFKFEDDRLYYAAKVILIALDYKRKIENGKLKADTKDKKPLDMEQYSRIFGTNRVPLEIRDCMTYNADSRHIVVAYKNNFYAVNVLGSDCARSSPDVEQMKSLLKEIVDNTKRIATPIGHLTTHNRDSWLKARKNLIEHPMNMESLCLIEKALFMVCLDDGLDSSSDDMTRSAEHLMHGGGVCQNSANRWFDKSIQFVISMDGVSGVIIEQSAIEGRIVANMISDIARNIPNYKARIGTECFPTPKQLCFCYNDEAKHSIEVAAHNMNEVVRNIDIYSYKFDHFGGEIIQAINFAPDSFVQLAYQLGYYRLHCRPAATYSPGVTRMFLHGRTDVIRSCSMETVDFVRSMIDKNERDLFRMLCFVEAAELHKQASIKVVNGEGIDRHLLGLRLAAIDLNIEVPPLFEDKGFKRSSYMRLNTAKVLFTCDSVGCIGPMVLDGFGIGYNIRDESINIVVSSLKSHQTATSRQLLEEIVLSMIDMKNLAQRVHK